MIKQSKQLSTAVVVYVQITLRIFLSFCVVLTIKTVFKGIAGGIVIASAFELLRRGSTYEQLVTAINDCLLPAGAKLIQIAEGSVNLKVQAENRLALDSLWRMYKNGTLKARLEALFVTDEMREVAGGEGVEIIVTIDEQEYDKARDELTTQARGKKSVTVMTQHYKKYTIVKWALVKRCYLSFLFLSKFCVRWLKLQSATKLLRHCTQILQKTKESTPLPSIQG